MKNPFFIDKSYKIRHRILEFLYRDWEKHDQEEGRSVGSIKIATDTNIPIKEIHNCQYLMVEKGEIIISNNDGQSIMTLQQNGITSYVDKRYIKEGKKERWDAIYDWSRIIIPLLALLLSIYNYFENNSIDARIVKIEKIIEPFKK